MKRLKDLIDHNIFRNKRIAIVEKSFVDCTFLIAELTEILYPIDFYSFYRKQEFYEQFNLNARTVFDENHEIRINENCIVDDYFTAQSVFDIKAKPSVCIFRSDSFNRKDTKNFHIIFEVNPLISGISSIYDGEIKVSERDIVHLESKFKIIDYVGHLD